MKTAIVYALGINLRVNFQMAMTFTDYQLVVTKQGSYLALSTEVEDKEPEFWKNVRRIVVGAIGLPIAIISYIY
ncbi:hypothetical protein SynA15127_02181 [Synechococcus sp. A15-127]|uniref:hypothetical protein n=1 Tax=Synechococcus sp. A15-127 TaxID=1050624 RepID=UPI0016440E4E|nr:hypothetical protein [Synechococcus sp. A15-127]QNI95248.1 hypothetical protein SynA15127_02181 [Synechococcus sp. A15-127]